MYLNFVWHFHQPIYHLPDSKEYLLPWVNYHATKNYWQMLRIVEEAEFPCTINLVPSLLEQIVDYAEEQACDPVLQALSKPAEKLSTEEFALLKRFFPVFHSEDSPARLQQRILEFHFSPLLQSETRSKEELLQLRSSILKELINYFKKLNRQGLIELTVTPFYHPLLPLLIDLAQARNEAPELPEFKHPGDARWHLETARQYFQETFGFAPAGLWPSEGAISQAACELMAASGYRYTMTDEYILWKSLDHRPSPALLNRPYESNGVMVFFRDRELSDLIGFEYHRWPAEQAVADFLRKLEKRSEGVPEEAVCSIILDGENPWGAYHHNGIDFLRLLFEKIKSSGRFRPILPGEYLSSHARAESLKIITGTWMSSFFKWVGHPEKVRTWKRLAEVRSSCGFSRYLAVAEGSDWFWWAGETEEKEFDLLFSSYLEKASAGED